MFSIGFEKYFEDFYVQEFKDVDSPFPGDWDNKPHKVWGDGVKVRGEFFGSRSGEQGVAGSRDVKTEGEFTTHPTTAVSTGTVLRRASDGLFIRLTGDPKESVSFAISQIKVFDSVVTDGQGGVKP